MVNKFTNKLKNEEYISKTLYEFINKNYNDYIPYNFDINIYNEICLEKGYEKYKEYFKENNIIDKELIKKILIDEDYIEIKNNNREGIIIQKTKYLTQINNIDPNRILILSFNKNNIKKLEQKLYLEEKINTNITEFYELGYKYIIEKNKNKKCYEVTNKTKDEIFYDYFNQYLFKEKDKLKEIVANNQEIFNTYFIENYEKYETYEEYYKNYKQHIIKSIPNLDEEIRKIIENDLGQEKIKTLKGEIAKSKGEAIIADFLTKNNIEYEYVQLNENKNAKDFTITSEDGKKIYIDYDVLPLNEEKPQEIPNQITINCISSDDIIKELIRGLTKYNIKHSKKPDEEIFEMILDQNPYSQIDKLKNNIQETINIIKQSSKRENYQEIITNYIDKLKGQEKNISNNEAKFIINYYEYYQTALTQGDTFGYDKSDLLYYAYYYIEQLEIVDGMDYKYILIEKDENVQQDRYEYIINLLKKTNAKIIVIENMD